MTSYLRENEVKNLQKGDAHLAQIPDFGMGYISRTIWRIEVSDCSLFFFIHALSFKLNLFFNRSFPSNNFQSSTFMNLCFVIDWEDDNRQPCEP